jgi:hypothetical protein
MALFKRVKVWRKKHVSPGLSGRVDELEKQLKEIVANKKQSDVLIAELETKLHEQIMRTERVEVLLRAYIITLRKNVQESDSKREATSRGLKTSLGVKLNKGSERKESKAPLLGQRRSIVKAMKEFMENIQGTRIETNLKWLENCGPS